LGEIIFMLPNGLSSACTVNDADNSKNISMKTVLLFFM